MKSDQIGERPVLSMNEKRSILRWGGLAGILGGVFSIITFVTLLVLVPIAPTDLNALVARFPSVRTATIIGESVLLAGYILFVMLFLALHRALRETSPASALFGSGVGILGYLLFIVGGLPPVAFSKISDFYHASSATPADQVTLAWVWQGIQSVFNETDTMGFVLVSIAIILLGIGMFRTHGFGKPFGTIAIVIGLLALVNISIIPVDSTSFAPIAILLITVMPILVGWKLYSLSRFT